MTLNTEVYRHLIFKCSQIGGGLIWKQLKNH